MLNKELLITEHKNKEGYYILIADEDSQFYGYNASYSCGSITPNKFMGVTIEALSEKKIITGVFFALSSLPEGVSQIYIIKVDTATGVLANMWGTASTAVYFDDSKAGQFVSPNDLGKPVQYYISINPPPILVGRSQNLAQRRRRSELTTSLRKEVRYV